MNLEKLKQLALINQINGPEAQPEDNSRTVLGLLQALMQQQGEKARMGQEAEFQQERLQQGQEGLDIRRDALEQQRLMNEIAAADKRLAAQTASDDRELGILMQAANAGDPVARRALAEKSGAYKRAGISISDETNTARRGAVADKIRTAYTTPDKLQAYLKILFANPADATGIPGATREDVNAAPWDEMNAGMPTPSPGFFSRLFEGNPVYTEPWRPPASFPQGGQLEIFPTKPIERPTQYGPPAPGLFDQMFGPPMPAQGPTSPEDAAKLLIQQMFSNR